MAAPKTTDEALEVLRRSNLLEPARLAAFLTLRPAGFADAAALCDALRADGHLTSFQVEQLSRGKHRGFFLGKYKILDRIGLGGMGQVFLAEHATMRRRVAIKVLPPDRADSVYSRERFLREARAAGQLDHPNIVRAFDFDADGEVAYLVMEYVDGVTFQDLVEKVGPLPPGRAAHYLVQVAHGLAYLHTHGLVHRDIKPANLLVDRQGVVKILDLGLVRSETDEDNLTRGEGVHIVGTADYLAPEQAIDCSSVDARADLYSLGATAYFLLTGRPPFVAEKVSHKLLAHQMTPVKPIRELRPEVPAGLSDVILQLLAKKPADRHANPTELIAALEPFAGELPPLPSEDEIPTTAGRLGAQSGTAFLGGPRPSRDGSSGGSGVGVGGSSVNIAQKGAGSSGSALRYHPDSKRLVETARAEVLHAITPAAPATPSRPPRPAGRDNPFAPPPPLSAAASHGQAPPRPAAPQPIDLPGLYGRPAEVAAPREPAPRPRPPVALILVFVAVLGVGLGIVFSLGVRPSAAAPPAERAAEKAASAAPNP